MPEQEKVAKEVVPIDELKRQVDKRIARDPTSIDVTGIGVHSSWSKFPCIHREENYILNKYCDGIIGIKMIGSIDNFQLELLAICNSQKTYIVQNCRYRDLIEYGKFTKCNTELIHISPKWRCTL